MTTYTGFYRIHISIIKKALSFVKSRISEYWNEQKTLVNDAQHDVIEKEVKEQIEEIELVETLFDTTMSKTFYHMPKHDHDATMDVARSALEIYLRNTVEAKAKLGLVGFDAKIEEIKEITNLGSLKDRRTDLYDRYYEAPRSMPEGKKFEVFFSYSHDDRVLAGKIANLMMDARTHAGLQIFLAHEDIEVSKEWREKIFEHLESSDILLALLTPSFEKSVWANQEAGYMRGKKGKVIPLIFEGADIKNFGFLEGLQGVPITEANLGKCVIDIMIAFLKR